ncbi:MAG: universal stress protein [Cyclobacteriaceae bacterium]|nr:universal stress protein [Cyclobacteriaceae bacterium]
MKKILVPTDFTECASQATQVALNLARRLGSWVYFLHISPEPAVKSAVHSDVELETHHQEVSRAKSQLDELVRKGEDMGVTCFPILVFDNGTEKIENYIKPYSIDLVVMGSHGARGIRKLVIGSNAQRVIRQVAVPVLVVKQIPDNYSIQTVLFASTFRQDLSPHFSWVANLVNGLKAKLHLLYLASATHPEPEQAAYSTMQKLTSAFPGLRFALDYAITNDFEWAIRNVGDKVQADLLCVSGHERDDGLWATNMATKLLDQEDRPVLVINQMQ